MGIADIPTKLGTDFLIRTVLPGLIAFFAFFEPIIHPLIYKTWNTLVFGDKLLVSFLLGFVIGLIFMLCDSYIYHLFEGLRFWPDFIWKWKFGKMEEYCQSLDEKLKDLNQEDVTELSSKEDMKLDLEIRKLSERMREFPPDIDKKRRYPKYPTRFGNVLCEYEEYSLNRYGIDMMVFWNHLIQVLPKETKEELKLNSAIADLCVYSCFTSLLYAILGPAALLFQEGSWITVLNYLIPAKSLLYLLFSILLFKVLYELSIIQHKNYGSFVKSIFDLYRWELARKLGIKVKRRFHTSEEELEEEKALWENYIDFYLHYRFINKKS